MLRLMNAYLSLGLVAFSLVWFVPGGRLMASETQERGPARVEPVERLQTPAGAETKNAHGEGAAAETAINPVKAEPGLALWTVVVFVLLMSVLTRFAWKPLLAALHSREQHLEHVLLETERARNESEPWPSTAS
jgi:F-type H+-transporting ATPase subunit b